MRISFVAATAALSLLIAHTSASAHAIWFAERHGKTAVIYGHGGTDEAYDPSKLKQVTALKADGSKVDAKIEVQTDHVLLALPEDAALITGFFDNGFWSKGPDGKWVNEAKTKVAGATESGHYIKYVTTILKPLGKAPTPQGMPLEIVAQSDPLTLKAGDELSVQVLANGKPVEGAELTAEFTTADEEPKLKTDKDGKATIKIRNQGINVIVADYTEKTPGNADADETGYTAALSFTLAHGEE